MNARWVPTALILAAAMLLVAGCPKPASWEIAEKALSPGSDLDKAEVHAELQRAMKRAEEEIAEDPEAVKPYETKASLQWIAGDFAGAVSTLQTALDRAKPQSDAEKESLKEHMMAAYLRAGSPEFLRKGTLYIESLIKAENAKNVYCYYMGLYYRKLYHLLGDGVFKTEANRWFLNCQLDPEIIEELQQEGLRDPLLE